MSAEYLTVTEAPGNNASEEEITRLHHRYHFASLLCRDKDVLEAACGPGMGLGYLGRVAKKVVGGDIDARILAIAERHYAGRPNIEVRRFDAQEMPFVDGSFDVVLMFEAIYYLPDPYRFWEEAKRVLRPGGVLVVCTVNREWADFNPSPYSVGYYSAVELQRMLAPRFGSVEIFGAFPVAQKSPRQLFVSALKRAAVKLKLMPRTMKGKEALKRVFFGRLVPIPDEIIDEPRGYAPPEPVSGSMACPSYKILYVLARR
jgi:SAM-dependent methyltransferase